MPFLSCILLAAYHMLLFPTCLIHLSQSHLGSQCSTFLSQAPWPRIIVHEMYTWLLTIPSQLMVLESYAFAV